MKWLSGLRGNNTTMDEASTEFLKAWRELDAIGDELGVPHEYVVCPMCGSHSWRFPPHGVGAACPLIEAMSEAASMKLEAERSTAIRLGLGMEDAMRKMLGDEDE